MGDLLCCSFWSAGRSYPAVCCTDTDTVCRDRSDWLQKIVHGVGSKKTVGWPRVMRNPHGIKRTKLVDMRVNPHTPGRVGIKTVWERGDLWENNRNIV